MASSFKRTDRIAEVIQRKLALLIPKEIKDPRLTGLITLSAVKVTTDLSYAKVYFTALNMDKQLALSILNASAPYLRSLLAGSISLRTIPQLNFIYDESIDYAAHLTDLIKHAKGADEAD